MDARPAPGSVVGCRTAQHGTDNISPPTARTASTLLILLLCSRKPRPRVVRPPIPGEVTKVTEPRSPCVERTLCPLSWFSNSHTTNKCHHSAHTTSHPPQSTAGYKAAPEPASKTSLLRSRKHAAVSLRDRVHIPSSTIRVHHAIRINRRSIHAPLISIRWLASMVVL